MQRSRAELDPRQQEEVSMVGNKKKAVVLRGDDKHLPGKLVRANDLDDLHNVEGDRGRELAG